MKKLLFVLLALSLLLCAGCRPNQAQAPDQTQPSAPVSQPSEPATDPTDPTDPPVIEPEIPETQDYTLKARNVPAVLAILQRDQVVDLVEEFDGEHYIVKVGQLYGLVETQYLRLPGQEPYAAWTGYAYHNARAYDHVRLQGEATKLSMNTKLEVLEGFEDVLLVKVNDKLCYVATGDVSKSYIQYSGGGNSGGGADGGDIELSVPQSGAVTGQATVLADGVELVLCRVSDTIQVITEDGFAQPWDGYLTVYIDGLCAYVQDGFVFGSDEEEYTPWTGYAALNAKVFTNFYLLGDAANKPALNAKLEIVGELDNCYILAHQDGEAYIAKELVNKAPVTYSSGGGGDEWSPPAM